MYIVHSQGTVKAEKGRPGTVKAERGRTRDCQSRDGADQRGQQTDVPPGGPPDDQRRHDHVPHHHEPDGLLVRSRGFPAKLKNKIVVYLVTRPNFAVNYMRAETKDRVRSVFLVPRLADFQQKKLKLPARGVVLRAHVSKGQHSRPGLSERVTLADNFAVHAFASRPQRTSDVSSQLRSTCAPQKRAKGTTAVTLSYVRANSRLFYRAESNQMRHNTTKCGTTTKCVTPRQNAAQINKASVTCTKKNPKRKPAEEQSTKTM